ncbi:MAG: GH16, partial [uncultured Acetobacteraceae bacterium]
GSHHPHRRLGPRQPGAEAQPRRLPGQRPVHGVRGRQAGRRHLHRQGPARVGRQRHPDAEGRLGRGRPQGRGQVPQRRLRRHRGHRPQPLRGRRHLQRRGGVRRGAGGHGRRQARHPRLHRGPAARRHLRVRLGGELGRRVQRHRHRPLQLADHLRRRRHVLERRLPLGQLPVVGRRRQPHHRPGEAGGRHLGNQRGRHDADRLRAGPQLPLRQGGDPGQGEPGGGRGRPLLPALAREQRPLAAGGGHPRNPARGRHVHQPLGRPGRRGRLRLDPLRRGHHPVARLRRGVDAGAPDHDARRQGHQDAHRPHPDRGDDGRAARPRRRRRRRLVRQRQRLRRGPRRHRGGLRPRLRVLARRL